MSDPMPSADASYPAAATVAAPAVVTRASAAAVTLFSASETSIALLVHGGWVEIPSRVRSKRTCLLLHVQLDCCSTVHATVLLLLLWLGWLVGGRLGRRVGVSSAACGGYVFLYLCTGRLCHILREYNNSYSTVESGQHGTTR